MCDQSKPEFMEDDRSGAYFYTGLVTIGLLSRLEKCGIFSVEQYHKAVNFEGVTRFLRMVEIYEECVAHDDAEKPEYYLHEHVIITGVLQRLYMRKLLTLEQFRDLLMEEAKQDADIFCSSVDFIVSWTHQKMEGKTGI